MIFNIYVFDKLGTLLYYDEWNRVKQSGISEVEEAKLMYGMLYSLKSFANKISPTGANKNQYLFYKTNKYALHMMETLSGLKFVLNTSPGATGVQEFLQQYYLKIWVEYATSNFLWPGGTTIESALFKTKSNEFIRNSSINGVKLV